MRMRPVSGNRRMTSVWVIPAILALVVTAGCDRCTRAATGPSPANAGAGGPFTITVFVSDFGHSPLADVIVEAPSPAGPLAMATTDASGYGRLQLPAGRATLRASRDGYDPAFANLDVSGMSSRANFLLFRHTEPGDMAGPYWLTVAASPSCTSLPPLMTRLGYEARLETRGDAVFVLLLESDRVVAWGGEAGFTGRRDGSTLFFDIRDTFDDGYTFISRTPSGDVHYQGTAVGQHRNGGITAILDGRIRLSPSSGTNVSAAECQAADHRLEFVRCEDPVNCSGW